MSSYSRIPFIISAESLHGPRSETRCHAASAMCLADDWAEEGCQDIRIADAEGVSRDRQQFRGTLLIVRQAAARRQGF